MNAMNRMICAGAALAATLAAGSLPEIGRAHV